jgi:hypothetical protein
MQRKPSGMIALVALAALTLAAAGCGGGGKNGSGTTAPPATTSTTATATRATTTRATTTAGSTASSFAGIASAADCRSLVGLSEKFASAVGGSADNVDTKKVSQLLQQFAEKAPSEVRPDFKVLADDYSKIADAVGNLKTGATPDAATLGKLQKLATQIDSAKLAQASQHITAWLRKNCSS